MKVLDPQAALLTNAEVYHFLQANPPRKPDKKSGAYEPVNLTEANNVRKDFKRYIDLTSPHVKQYPAPEKYINNVVRRLRYYGLTKTEALSLINLGLGLPRLQPANANLETNGHSSNTTHIKEESEDANPANETSRPVAETSTRGADSVEPNHRALADCVIESIGERFPGDEGEQKIEEILNVLTECIENTKLAEGH